MSVVVVAVRGLASVQDAGRPGRMHEGVPPGGALVPELMARANRAVGNADGAPAIEIFGAIDIMLTAGGIASIDGESWALAAGELLACAPHPRRRVRYVAVAGGFDVPHALGGRGTLLVASLGGHEGRALRRGDRLPRGVVVASSSSGVASAASTAPGGSVASSAAELAPFDDDPARVVRVVPGPDGAHFAEGALAALLAGPFRIGLLGDRGGVRLTGPALARTGQDDGLSAPMVIGAIEVPAAGEPIVLGPDHPTTGGYPVLATVVRADMGTLLARKPGAEVRFVRA